MAKGKDLIKILEDIRDFYIIDESNISQYSAEEKEWCLNEAIKLLKEVK